MQKNLIVFLLFLAQITFAQQGIFIYSKSYQGVIIPKENNPDSNQSLRLRRFTPTEKQVRKLEKALIIVNSRKIKNVDANRLPPKPICDDLTKYVRQYFGFYNGETKLILVQLFARETFTTAKEIWKWKYQIGILEYPESEYPTLRFDVKKRKFQENYACPENK